MGFRPQATTYNLNFEDIPNLNGLEVKILSCTVGEMNIMLRIRASTGDELVEGNNKITELFLEHLVSWNLEGNDGQPLPKTLEALDKQEPGIVTQMIAAWHMAMMSVPTNLKMPSTNGGSSEEALLGLVK